MPRKWEMQMKSSKNSDDTNNTDINNTYSPLRKYAPSPSDTHFRNLTETSNAPSDHRQVKIRGRERTKKTATLKGQGNIFDNPEHSKSFPPMKYRSMSCEDARQAVNESLVKVSSMQHLLEKRR